MNNKRRSNPSKLQNYQASRGDRNHKNDYNYKDERQDDLPRQRKLGYVEKLLNSFGFIQSVDDVSNSQGKRPASPDCPDNDCPKTPNSYFRTVIFPLFSFQWKFKRFTAA